jgi:hypothetical protein
LCFQTAGKAGGILGNVAVAVEGEVGEVGLKRLQEAMQQQQQKRGSNALANPAPAVNTINTTLHDHALQPQFQVCV